MSGWLIIGGEEVTGTLKDIGGRPEARVYKGRAWPIETDEPDMESYLSGTLMGDEHSEAIDGCGGIEADGQCQHGAPSWELYWGVI